MDEDQIILNEGFSRDRLLYMKKTFFVEIIAQFEVHV